MARPAENDAHPLTGDCIRNGCPRNHLVRLIIEEESCEGECECPHCAPIPPGEGE